MRTKCLLLIAMLFALVGTAPAGTSEPSATSAQCAPAVFLVLESGRLAGVDWVEYKPGQVHTRTVLTQSRSMDATIDLRPDGTAVRSSVEMTMDGDQSMSMAPKVRDLGQGSIYWSDMTPSSVEQAIARARVLNQPLSRIPTASMFSDIRGDAVVERIDATDWVITFRNKRYQVLTDDHGCMLAATLAEYGVTIERRAGFDAAQYPVWPAYGAPPDHPYRAVDVAIPAPQGHVLAGTLTTPPGPGPFPAAVLITGLSPHERNNGMPPWMPFRDISDALTRAGIAVLRVDDRGVGKSTGDHAPSTTFDEADDVRTEVAWLRARSDIDGKRIALVGYSEGGLIAPMVASKDRSIAAIITLAGPGTSGAQLARYQIEQAVIHDPDIREADREKEIQKQLAEEMTPRERVVLTIDPMEFAREVRCPALIIQGGSDAHVPVRSAERIGMAMRSNGNADVTVRIFPGVSHTLLPDPNGVSAGWVFLPAFGTWPPLLDAMTDWARTHLLMRHAIVEREEVQRK